ncbi:hypothetical protein PRK78_006677 [Emydomyces testavorans]|uniref:Uncharacterized protein n=1 Tax=Emydomyces testavorans TaxID=2070801 RepID=A0AAF0DM71_9EURO|nr:hypothetical protein PRK78_006677 [Emydomyces testavorans]
MATRKLRSIASFVPPVRAAKGEPTFLATIQRLIPQDTLCIRIRLSPTSHARWLLEKSAQADGIAGFVSSKLYLMFATCGKGKLADSRPIERSWTTPAMMDDLLDLVKDWRCKDTVIPPIEKPIADTFIACPLLRLDPLETWVSPGDA